MERLQGATQALLALREPWVYLQGSSNYVSITQATFPL